MTSGGHPIACPFLREYAAEAESIPDKARKAHGAPRGGVEINHWLNQLLDLAEKATECPSREGGDKRRGRYEVTRQRALERIWGAYMEVQGMSGSMASGKYEVTESYKEVRQRNRLGIIMTSKDVEEL